MVKRTQIYNVNDIFERRVYESDGYKLPYRLYIPQDYDCGEKYPVMPPGAGSFDRFTSRCVGCGLCIAACKGKYLQLSAILL